MDLWGNNWNNYIKAYVELQILVIKSAGNDDVSNMKRCNSTLTICC